MSSGSRTSAVVDEAEIERNSERAEALAFLYANDELGFTAEDVSEQTSLSPVAATDHLNYLFEADLVQKTADGYYLSFDDPIVARAVDRLWTGDSLTVDTGKEPYPDEI